jgi:hypothetical protein
MSGHTPATITLRQEQGRKAIIARQDIEIMHVSKVTMVPEGLEKHIRFGRPQTCSVCKSRPLMLLSSVVSGETLLSANRRFSLRHGSQPQCLSK